MAQVTGLAAARALGNGNIAATVVAAMKYSTIR
jgi:hypothetical protein